MGRARTGTIVEKDGRIYGRVRYIDEHGRRKELYLRADTRTDARKLVRDKINELDDHGVDYLEAGTKTFADLVDYYRTNHIVAAVIHEGRKVAGLKSLRGKTAQLEAAADYFVKRPLRAITAGDIERYKLARTRTPVRTRASLAAAISATAESFEIKAGQGVRFATSGTVEIGDEAISYASLVNDTFSRLSRGEKGTVVAEHKAGATVRGERPRSLTTVNRELETLRNMFNVAIKQGWLLRNPASSRGLISNADEHKRTRILSRDEESRLLAACTGARAHLLALVVAAIDTGMRWGEQRQLVWGDIDLVTRTINVRETTTKTEKARAVPISDRLLAELSALAAVRNEPQNPQELVFGIKANVQRSFTGALRVAGIGHGRRTPNGLVWHDFRHTAGTRMAEVLPLPQVGRILGHSQPQTTYRYVNANAETIKNAREAIDAFNKAGVEKVEATVSEMVN